MNGVTTQQIGERHPSGIGWVTIPSDQTPAIFIERCYRSGSISIILENGGIINNVLVAKSAFPDLEFPENSTQLGSFVCWVNQPNNNQPMVVAVLTKRGELVGMSKGKATFKKESVNGIASFMLDANTGSIFINATSLSENGGDIFIIANNQNKEDKKSTLNINISGKVNINTPEVVITNSKKFTLNIADAISDGNTASLTYTKGIGLDYVDEFGNEIHTNKDNIQLIPAKILNIGTGKEPITKADSLESVLNSLVDICVTITDALQILQVPTPMGPSGFPINATKFLQASSSLNELRNQFVMFKSEISKTD